MHVTEHMSAKKRSIISDMRKTYDRNPATISSDTRNRADCGL